MTAFLFVWDKLGENPVRQAVDFGSVNAPKSSRLTRRHL